MNINENRNSNKDQKNTREAHEQNASWVDVEFRWYDIM